MTFFEAIQQTDDMNEKIYFFCVDIAVTAIGREAYEALGLDGKADLLAEILKTTGIARFMDFSKKRKA